MNNFSSDQEEGKLLPGQSRLYPFALPENYFDALPARIMTRIESVEELRDFALLSELPKKIQFETPADYFRASANDLECLFEVTSSPQLVKGELKPEGAGMEDYFASLDERMAKRFEIADELKQYPLLGSIDKKNNFAFDPDYFDTIADRVKEKKYAEQNNGISLIERILSHVLKPKMALSYSMVLIIMAAVAWFSTRPEEKTFSGDCKTLACLEKNELLNEKTIEDFDTENLYEMVDVEELDKQISSEDAEDVIENNDSVIIK